MSLSNLAKFVHARARLNFRALYLGDQQTSLRCQHRVKLLRRVDGQTEDLSGHSLLGWASSRSSKLRLILTQQVGQLAMFRAIRRVGLRVTI
jgi:hypothetical protein